MFWPKREPVVWVLVGLCLLGTTLVKARSVTVIPKTSHTTLTMSNDNAYGYQVYPKNPLRIEVVGPGRLTFTVRLNSTHKRKTFQGIFEVRRGRKKPKKNKLKLGRSRVGSYLENKGLLLSSPRTFRYKVSKGRQSYVFSLNARRGITLTLSLAYETQVDQSSVLPDDAFALVPLVKIPKTKRAVNGESDPGDLPPVPLATLAKKTLESGSTTQQDANTSGPADRDHASLKVAAQAPLEDRSPHPTMQKAKPDQPNVPHRLPSAGHETRRDTHTTAVVHNRAPQPTQNQQLVQTSSPSQYSEPAGVEAASTDDVDVFSIGLKAGQISPIQSIGSSTFTASLDIRYVLPALSGRLTLGVEAAFHHYSMALVYPNRLNNINMDMTVIPLSLQLFYRMGFGTAIEPFVGAGADVFLTWANVGYQNDPDNAESGSAIGLGGHVSFGLEAHLGPGFLVLEGRAGLSKVDLNVANRVNVAGITSVAGYRLQF